MNNEENNTSESSPEVSPILEPTPTPTPAAESEVQSVPVAAPVSTSQPEPASPQPHINTPGVIILQWLSYAFWGWLILALIWLMAVILINAIMGVSVSAVVPYAIAATVVLLPIAFLTDFFYRKHEPLRKTGAAMIIMVIHAVIFAILGIGALIVAVFNGLNALIEASGNTDTQMVILYTSLGATALYALTFTRTLNPFKNKKPLTIYSILMVVISFALLALAVVGPLVQTIATKDDRRIENALPMVATSINEYIVSNEELPKDLNDVTYESTEAESLVEDGLVTFKPEANRQSLTNPDYTYHRYQLCVTYKAKSEDSANGYTSYGGRNDYSNYVSTYGHGKGEVCYKVEETVWKNDTSNSIDLDLNLEMGN